MPSRDDGLFITLRSDGSKRNIASRTFNLLAQPTILVFLLVIIYQYLLRSAIIDTAPHHRLHSRTMFLSWLILDILLFERSKVR